MKQIKTIQKNLVLILFAILLFNSVSLAATYYIDASNGNDNKDGFSPSTAWKTIKKVNNSHFEPGDQILFKRGTIWRERLIPPSSGSSNSPILFGNYGKGNKPSIRGSNLYNKPDNWIKETTNIWYLPNIHSDPVIFSYNETLGVRKSSKKNLEAQWNYFYDNINNRLYLYSIKNPTDLSSQLEVAQRPYVIGPQWTDYITFNGLDLRHAYSETWIGWNSTNVIFQNCNLTQSANNHLQFHNGSNHGKVLKCTFNDWNVRDDRNYAIQTIGKGDISTGPVDIIGCVFDASRKGGGGDHTVIMNDNNSWIREFSLNTINGNKGNIADDGIVIWRLSASAKSVTIEDNIINEVGGVGISIQEIEYHSASPIISVRRNTIRESCLNDDKDKEALRLRTFSHLSKVDISYNIINSVKKGNYIHPGIGLSDVSEVKIYNNVIYKADNGIELKSSSINLKVKNNIIIKNRMYGIKSSIGFLKNSFDYNCIFENFLGNYYGVKKGDNDVNKDPIFIDIDSSNFHLSPTSPCRNKGTFVDLEYHRNEISTHSGSAPDIGAYEYDSNTINPPKGLLIRSSIHQFN